MRKLVMLAILVAPLTASAEYLDVIQGKLKDKCTLQNYVAMAHDFNDQWGKAHGYTAQIGDPVQSSDIGFVFWVGHTANAEAWGKAWDTWRTELGDPKSVASKLNERFEKCATTEGRRGYDMY
jgi:hypothetical protein